MSYPVQPPTGIKCPKCGERILILVKHPKTGKKVCPACGKPVKVG